MPGASQYEVKGLWFSSARDWLTRAHGVEVRQRVVERMGEHAHVLEDPISSEWYPEEALQAVLAGMRWEIADGHAERFAEVIREMVSFGIGRFFRMILQLGSAGFVMRKVPVLWDRVQRGPGSVTVDSHPDRAVIRYRNFPYFADPNFIIMTSASLQAMVRTSTGKVPDSRIVDSGKDWLDVEITFPG